MELSKKNVKILPKSSMNVSHQHLMFFVSQSQEIHNDTQIFYVPLAQNQTQNDKFEMNFIIQSNVMPKNLEFYSKITAKQPNICLKFNASVPKKLDEKH